jgi:hypothetical protein
MTGDPGRLGHLLACRPPAPVVALVLVGTAAVTEAADSPAATAAWVTALAGYVLLAVQRGRVPCTWCAEAMPLDVAGVASRRRRMLWLHHLVVPSIWRVAALTVGPFLVLLALALAGLDWAASWPAVAVALMPLAVVAQAVTVHQRLRPWCPWCRGGGGGDRIVDPEPDPAIRQPV